MEVEKRKRPESEREGASIFSFFVLFCFNMRFKSSIDWRVSFGVQALEGKSGAEEAFICCFFLFSFLFLFLFLIFCF